MLYSKICYAPRRRNRAFLYSRYTQPTTLKNIIWVNLGGLINLVGYGPGWCREKWLTVEFVYTRWWVFLVTKPCAGRSIGQHFLFDSTLRSFAPVHSRWWFTLCELERKYYSLRFVSRLACESTATSIPRLASVNESRCSWSRRVTRLWWICASVVNTDVGQLLPIASMYVASGRDSQLSQQITVFIRLVSTTSDG